MRRMAAVIVGGLVACTGPTEEPEPPSLAVEFTAPAGTGEPNLSVDGEDMFLTWHEPRGEDASALRFAVRANGVWSDPVDIAAERGFFVNWADFPSLTRLADGTLLVHWLERVASSPYAYHVMVARSQDAGASWSEPEPIHEDLSPTEHGFVSVVPLDDGDAALLWLDGRATGSGEGHAGAMQLWARTLSPDGAVGPEWQVDARVCDCCQTGLALVQGQLVAAYRDRSEDEIRDIAVSRLGPEGWSPPVHLGQDEWHYTACPVNGPALAVNGDTLAVAWYTGADSTPAVNLAFSVDGARSFGPPIRLASETTLGRVDAEFLPDGSVLVVWLEREGAVGRLSARTVSPDGTLGPVLPVTDTDPSRRSGFPRLARVGNELLLAWTVVGDKGGVRVASLAGFGLEPATE